MGYSRDVDEFNIDSMPCSVFEARDDKQVVELESLTVYSIGTSNRIHGIKAQLNDGSLAYYTPNQYPWSNLKQYEMLLSDFKADQIFIQAVQANNDYFMPVGWKITSRRDDQQNIDVYSALQPYSQGTLYDYLYTTLKPSQIIIGVYGIMDTDYSLNDGMRYYDYLESIGFIVKEEIEVE